MYGKFKKFKNTEDMVKFLEMYKHVCGQGGVSDFKFINDNIVVVPKDPRYEPMTKKLLSEGFEINKEEKGYEITPLQSSGLLKHFLEFNGEILPGPKGSYYYMQVDNLSEEDKELTFEELIEMGLLGDPKKSLVEMAKILDMKAIVDEFDN